MRARCRDGIAGLSGGSDTVLNSSQTSAESGKTFEFQFTLKPGSDAGWVKADWLAPGRLECSPVAGAPECGGFLTCWWVDAGAGTWAADAAKACLKEWIYGTK